MRPDELITDSRLGRFPTFYRADAGYNTYELLCLPELVGKEHAPVAVDT